MPNETSGKTMTTEEMWSAIREKYRDAEIVEDAHHLPYPFAVKYRRRNFGCSAWCASHNEVIADAYARLFPAPATEAICECGEQIVLIDYVWRRVGRETKTPYCRANGSGLHTPVKTSAPEEANAQLKAWYEQRPAIKCVQCGVMTSDEHMCDDIEGNPRQMKYLYGEMLAHYMDDGLFGEPHTFESRERESWQEGFNAAAKFWEEERKKTTSQRPSEDGVQDELQAPDDGRYEAWINAYGDDEEDTKHISHLHGYHMRKAFDAGRKLSSSVVAAHSVIYDQFKWEHKERIRLQAKLAEARNTIAGMVAAINWASGCDGDFRRDSLGGKFWWRSELTRRAGLTYDAALARYRESTKTE